MLSGLDSYIITITITLIFTDNLLHTRHSSSCSTRNSLNPHNNYLYKVTTIIPIWQMKKLKHRKVHSLTSWQISLSEFSICLNTAHPGLLTKYRCIPPTPSKPPCYVLSSPQTAVPWTGLHPRATQSNSTLFPPRQNFMPEGNNHVSLKASLLLFKQPQFTQPFPMCHSLRPLTIPAQWFTQARDWKMLVKSAEWIW